MQSAKRDQKAIWREFGPWLRRQREIAGKTRKQVAAEIDIHPVQLARIETGESGTRPDTLDLLIRCLNLDPKEAYRRAGFWPETKSDVIGQAITDAIHFHEPEGLTEAGKAMFRNAMEEVRLEKAAGRASTLNLFISIFIDQMIDLRSEMAEMRAEIQRLKKRAKD